MKQVRIRIISIFITALLLVIFYSAFKNVDLAISNSFNKIIGEREPDSSIIIIHLTESDLEQIGPWPIKRSYYALLIQYLNQLDVKNIGIEIFLSAKFASQSIYDKVLQNEIEKSDDLILSSIAGVIKENNNQFSTDSLSLPSPKLINEKLTSGHTNFIRDYGIQIPLILGYGNQKEKAFAFELFDDQIEKKELKINFTSSWQKFRNYSFIEFLQMVQQNDAALGDFQGKTIIIGVSDKQLSSGISTIFDENLPGVALHAFALDNMKQARSIITDYYNYSIPFFFLLCFLWAWLAANSRLQWQLIILFSGFASLLLLSIFLNVEIGFSYFVVPGLVLFSLNVYWNITDSKKRIKGYFNETEILKNLLNQKEKELSILEKELNLTESGDSALLLDRIRDLKVSINLLKENEEDLKEVIPEPEETSNNFHGIVYRSNKMQMVVDMIKKAAPTDAVILIMGESGTGKELVANAIHKLSKRNANKLVSLNCAALSESLLESELFGHVKGAFTGALNDKTGKFEQADKGTIFLDEIGETSENFQVKLLRVLQSGEFDKVGSENTSKVDVRVIAATNKDLKKLINEKKFREDLYYRLNVISIFIDPLRERKEDIEVLINHFLTEDKTTYQISVAAKNALTNHDWKGNVRELESTIKRAKVFCQTDNRSLIQLNDLPREIVQTGKHGFEELVLESLRSKKFSHSSINETSKDLGNVSRTLVSENFRGYSLKTFVEANYDVDKTSKIISQSEDDEIVNKVRSKIEVWLSNINKDLKKRNTKDFDVIKSELNSKYKNLPQKYHTYLDLVIKELLKKS